MTTDYIPNGAQRLTGITFDNEHTWVFNMLGDNSLILVKDSQKANPLEVLRVDPATGAASWGSMSMRRSFTLPVYATGELPAAGKPGTVFYDKSTENIVFDNGVRLVPLGVSEITLPITPGQGGTGIDTSGSEGTAYIIDGKWAVSPVLPQTFGGTGLDTSTAPLGSLLMGTGSGLQLGGIVAGRNVHVESTPGWIVISADSVVDLASKIIRLDKPAEFKSESFTEVAGGVVVTGPRRVSLAVAGSWQTSATGGDFGLTFFIDEANVSPEVLVRATPWPSSTAIGSASTAFVSDVLAPGPHSFSCRVRSFSGHKVTLLPGFSFAVSETPFIA